MLKYESNNLIKNCPLMRYNRNYANVFNQKIQLINFNSVKIH